MCSCSRNLKPKYLLENFRDESIVIEDIMHANTTTATMQNERTDTDCMYTTQGLLVCQKDTTQSSTDMLGNTFDEQRVFFNTSAQI